MMPTETVEALFVNDHLEHLQQEAAKAGDLASADAIHQQQGVHEGYPSGPQPVVSLTAGIQIEQQTGNAVVTEEAQAYELTAEETRALADLENEGELGILAPHVSRAVREKFLALGLLPDGVPLDPPIPIQALPPSSPAMAEGPA